MDMDIDMNDMRFLNNVTILFNNKKGISTVPNYLIQKLFEDEACFFKMSKEDAMQILGIIGMMEVGHEKNYLKLTSFKMYKELVEKGALSPEEVVFENNYELTDVFDKKEVSEEESLAKIEKQNVFNKLLDKIRYYFKHKNI